MDDWPLGTVGCIVSNAGATLILVLSLWIFVLISIDRNISLHSRHHGLHWTRSGNSGPSARQRFYTICLALTLFACATVGGGYFVSSMLWNNAVQAMQVTVDDVAFGTKTVTICGIFFSKFLVDKASIGWPTIFVSLAPAFIITFNYM